MTSDSLAAPTTITREHWQVVDKLLHGALICTRDHRDAFIANSCGDDAALRSEVAALLAAYDALPPAFLERPAMAEHGVSSAAVPVKPRRLVPASLVVYVAVAGILLGAVAGSKLAHSTTVDRWRGALRVISQGSAPPNADVATAGRISPHRHWIAYASRESGRDEVYVDSYPQPGTRVMVSQSGGSDPAWRDDGRELYYWRGDALVALPIDGSQLGRPPILGPERVLLTRPVSVR